MKNVKKISATQVERFLNYLNNLSEEISDKLDRGELVLKFEIVEGIENNKNKSKQQSIFNHSIDFTKVIDEMLSLASRQDGEKYLQEKLSNKLEYIELAKKLDLPFSKKESVEKIKSKIIEATIGYRIRSHAINLGVQNSERSIKNLQKEIQPEPESNIPDIKDGEKSESKD